MKTLEILKKELESLKGIAGKGKERGILKHQIGNLKNSFGTNGNIKRDAHLESSKTHGYSRSSTLGL